MKPILDLTAQTNSMKGKGKTILVTDDDIETLDETSKQLSQYGFCVLRATNGEKAFEICKSASIDLVLSDVFMPVMDGIVLFEKLQQAKPLLPVALISVAPLPEWFRIKHPKCIFIEKTYETSRLVDKLSTILNCDSETGKLTNVPIF